MDNESTLQQTMEVMAMLHKQNMEMLDRIITLKTIGINEGVKNEIPTDTTDNAEC